MTERVPVLEVTAVGPRIRFSLFFYVSLSQLVGNQPLSYDSSHEGCVGNILPASPRLLTSPW